MAQPTTKAEFKQFCLRALGAPVIEINVDDDQVDDRIDQALQFCYDYHHSATERVYVKHLITANTISDGYVDLPDNIIGAVKVFSIHDQSLSGTDIFNIRYQIALNDLHNLANLSILPYYMQREQLALIHEVLVGETLIRFNRHKHRLFIDDNDLTEGTYLVFECHEVVDPDTWTDAWSDRILQRYATALIKQQWGSNLTKFEGLQLPGGVQFNGGKIYDDASAEILKMEDEILQKHAMPPLDFIG